MSCSGTRPNLTPYSGTRPPLADQTVSPSVGSFRSSPSKSVPCPTPRDLEVSSPNRSPFQIHKLPASHDIVDIPLDTLKVPAMIKEKPKVRKELMLGGAGLLDLVHMCKEEASQDDAFVDDDVESPPGFEVEVLPKEVVEHHDDISKNVGLVGSNVGSSLANLFIYLATMLVPKEAFLMPAKLPRKK